MKKKGKAEAIWSHSECLSWNQMYARVNQYAQWFLAQNVKPGNLVVMYMANSPDFMCAWFGLMAVGAAPAMINTNLASKALVHCVEIAQAKLILADGDVEMLGRLEGVRADLEASGHEIVILGHVRDHILGLNPARPADELRGNIRIDSPMMLAYTSGTTGLPKAIVFPMLIVILTSSVVGGSFGSIPPTSKMKLCLLSGPTEEERLPPTQVRPRETVQLYAVLPWHRGPVSLPSHHGMDFQCFIWLILDLGMASFAWLTQMWTVAAFLLFLFSFLICS